MPQIITTKENHATMPVLEHLLTINVLRQNVYHWDGEYQRGDKLSKQEMERYEKRLIRNPAIDRWSLKIEPTQDSC